MGACLGHSRHVSSSENHVPVSVARNHALTCDLPKWRSDIPLTEGQLLSKRDEFWETAPAFEGKPEIWNALRAATNQLEQGDYVLAQAILNGANISLPNGTLSEAYDELGTRYQLPVYVLCVPSNLIEHSATVNSTPASNASEINKTSSEISEGLMCRLRLSCHERDIKMSLNLCASIHHLKQELAASLHLKNTQVGAVGVWFEEKWQRWFYGGHMLNDQSQLKDSNIIKGHVIQVILNTETPDSL